MSKSLFGASLFSKKKKVEIPRLYDFAQHGVLNNPEFNAFNANDYVTWTYNVTNNSSVTMSPTLATQVGVIPQVSEETKKKDEENAKKNITPKELYNLKVLNQIEFGIECSDNYIKENVALLQKKLKMMRGDSGAVKYGKEELASLIERIENRRHIKKFKTVLDKYPHTTSEAIGSILNKEDHLRCKSATEFIPDFPKDAIEAMEEYEKVCMDLCKKKPVFYVIADKKDFGEIDRKRDPILLAQSPFGFFWQILGAWDDEMVFLGDL
jgi:hypothetical protein